MDRIAILTTLVYLLLLTFLTLVNSGCSISYSLETSSDSIATSSDSFFSISRSSGGSEKEVEAALQRYSDDVSGLTVSYFRENGDTYTFERQLGSIARSYGLINWQREAATYQAIGSGLRQAGVKKDTINSTIFLQSSTMELHLETIVEGYLDA